MNPDQIKHLEFIQSIITRMNTNSFQLKGMAITIVSAFIAIYTSTTNVTFIFIGIAPTVLFWFLDAYYLQQERKFRGIYNIVSGVDNSFVINLFEMPIHKIKGEKYAFCNSFWSKTIVSLYGSIIIALSIAGLILVIKTCNFTLICK